MPDHLLEEISRRWVKDLHGWFNKVSKGFVDISQKEFEEKLNELEKILFSVSNPHFEIVDNIDRLLTIKKPKKKDVEYLKTLLTSWSIYTYFFDKAEENWLSLLAVADFFKKPPMQRIWPESRYLARIASKNPEEVMDIIKSCPSTENPSVHDDFLQASMNMPIEVGQQIIPLIQKGQWLQSKYHILLPHRLADFMTRLAKNESLELAFRIALILTDVTADKPKRLEGVKGPLSVMHPDAKPTFNDERQYKRIIEENMEELKAQDSARLLWIFCLRLGKALELEHKGSTRARGFYEYSHIWRPSIEEARFPNHEDTKSVLIGGIVEIINLIGSNNPKNLKKVADTIQKSKHPVFRRIEMYLYRKFPSQFLGDIDRILTDRRAINANNLKREYLPLLKEHFVNLIPKSQNKILREIKSGLGFKRNKDWPIKKFKIVVSQQQLLYLQPIADKLPPVFSKWFKGMHKKYGEIQDHDGEMKSWTGPESPTTLDEFNKKTPEEIIQYLFDWVPPEDEFRSPSAEGLGRLFQQAVLERPAAFSKMSHLIFEKRIRPVYIYHLFYGLKDALKNNKCFEWQPVLELGVAIVSIKDYSIFPKTTDKFEPDWRAVRKSMVDLIGDGFSSKNCSIPFNLRIQTWEVVNNISDDEDPTLEHEKRYGGDNMDPATMSINTTRGEAMHTVIKYALWCSRNLYPSKEDAAKIESKLMPEVKKVLDKHLDPSVDPTLTIRAVYGWHLPNLFYLDKKWVIQNIENIFPQDPNQRQLLIAGWETYLSNSVYNDVFPALKEKYQQSIALLGATQKKGHQYANLDELLPHHFMAAYVNNLASEELIDEFFEKAPAEARGTAHNFSGRVVLKKELAKISPSDTGIKIEKLKNLWEKRLGIPKEKQDKEEFKEFGWWFARSPFDRKWTINQMVRTIEISQGEIEPEHEIPEELLKYVDEFPLQSINILNLMARGDKTNWQIQSSSTEYRTIIQTAIKSGNAKAKEIAFDLVHFLGKRGYLEYRDLLK